MANSSIEDINAAIVRLKSLNKHLKVANDNFLNVYGSIGWEIISEANNIADYYNAADENMQISQTRCDNIIKYCYTIIEKYEEMENQIVGLLTPLSKSVGDIIKKIPVEEITQSIKTEQMRQKLEQQKQQEAKKQEQEKKKDNGFFGSIKSALKDVKDTACDFGEWMIYVPIEEKVKDVGDIGKEVTDTVGKTIKKSAATACNVGESFAFGGLQFVENLTDGLAVLGTGILSVPTGIWDGVKWTGSKAFGYDYKSSTKAMWERTKDFTTLEEVKCQRKILEETEHGQWVKENSYNYEMVKNTSAIVGQIASTIALTLATGGIAGGAAVTGTTAIKATAAMASVGTLGESTSRSWNEGASTTEGLAYGAASAAVTYGSWYIGGKIGTCNIGSGQSIASKVGTLGIRVTGDAVDGALAMPIDAGVQKLVYKQDESYGSIFKQQGGWKSILTNTFIAAGMSGTSSAIDVKRGTFMKQSDSTANINTEKSQTTKQNNIDNIEANTDKIPSIEQKNSVDDIEFDEETIAIQSDPSPPKLENDNRDIQAELRDSYRNYKKGLKDLESFDIEFPELKAMKVFDEAIDKAIAEVNDVDAANMLKKVKDTDMFFIKNSEFKSSYTPHDNYIHLDDSTIKQKHYDIIFHELGHGLWEKTRGAAVPSNYDSIRNSAIKHMSENKKFTKEYLQMLDEDIEIIQKQAEAYYDENFAKELEELLNEEIYSKELFEQYKEEFGNEKSDSEIKKIIYTDIEEVKKNTRNEYVLEQEYNHILKSGTGAESDIINSIIMTQDVTIMNGKGEYEIVGRLKYGHRDEYYKTTTLKKGEQEIIVNRTLEAQQKICLHEQIANFMSLKLTNKTDSLNNLRMLLGEEWYTMMENEYQQILNYFK